MNQPTPVIPQYNQDPQADLDYLIDWSVWMAREVGDTIATSEWAVTPAGPTLHTKNLNPTTSKATAWFKGGTLGVNYIVTNSITTVAGRAEDQTIRIFIQQH